MLHYMVDDNEKCHCLCLLTRCKIRSYDHIPCCWMFLKLMI